VDVGLYYEQKLVWGLFDIITVIKIEDKVDETCGVLRNVNIREVLVGNFEGKIPLGRPRQLL
jgi:hypothetical protein